MNSSRHNEFQAQIRKNEQKAQVIKLLIQHGELELVDLNRNRANSFPMRRLIHQMVKEDIVSVKLQPVKISNGEIQNRVTFSIANRSHARAYKTRLHDEIALLEKKLC